MTTLPDYPLPTELHAWGYHLVPWSRNPRIPAMKGYLQPESQQRLTGYLRMPSLDWAILPTDTVCLDLEMKKGLDGIRDLLDMGFDWREMTCPATKTKSCGLHLWFRQPEGAPLVGGERVRLAPGIECKAQTGTCHIPPSVGYICLRPLRPKAELPMLPDTLAEKWRSVQTVRRDTKDYDLMTIPVGERRAFALAVAGKLRNTFAATTTEIAAFLLAMRDTRMDDAASMSDEEIHDIAKDMARRDIDEPTGLALAKDPYAASVLALCQRAVERLKS